MANLKIKTIMNNNRGLFDEELEQLISEVADASIQYRTTTSTTGTIYHSALVVYYNEEKEVEADITNAPTGLKREDYIAPSSGRNHDENL